LQTATGFGVGAQMGIGLAAFYLNIIFPDCHLALIQQQFIFKIKKLAMNISGFLTLNILQSL